MKQSLSVSGISKQTGIDRRTIDRALIDLEPVDSAVSGDRTSLRYDRDLAAVALAAAGVPRSKVARLMPFGGSVSRLVAWNTLVAYVAAAQRVFALDRADWPADFGVSAAQADRIAARVAVQVAMIADDLLANFGARCEDSARVDDVLARCELPVRDAKPGEFVEAVTVGDPGVVAMFEAARAAKKSPR